MVCGERVVQVCDGVMWEGVMWEGVMCDDVLSAGAGCGQTESEEEES